LSFVLRLLSSDLSPQGPRFPAGVGTDDLSGVQDALRVEDALQFAEDRHEWTVLSLHPRRARDSGAVLRADCAAERKGQPVNGFCNGPEVRPVGRIVQIKQRTCVNLPGKDVNEECPGHFEPLQNVLRASEELRQRIRRDADILDERKGPSCAGIVQSGDGRESHAVDLCLSFGITRRFGQNAKNVFPLKGFDSTPGPFAGFALGFGFENDTERRSDSWQSDVACDCE
jgi:hypothetical protein